MSVLVVVYATTTYSYLHRRTTDHIGRYIFYRSLNQPTRRPRRLQLRLQPRQKPYPTTTTTSTYCDGDIICTLGLVASCGNLCSSQNDKGICSSAIHDAFFSVLCKLIDFSFAYLFCSMRDQHVWPMLSYMLFYCKNIPRSV